MCTNNIIIDILSEAANLILLHSDSYLSLKKASVLKGTFYLDNEIKKGLVRVISNKDLLSW